MGHKFALTNPRAHGFSLLELIIVLVIIGVLVASITLSITDTRSDNLHFEARRLAARLSLAIDEAIIAHQEYGLEVSSDSYRFLVLDDERWSAISALGEKQLIQQKLPEGMEIQLVVDGLFSQFLAQGSGNKWFKTAETDDHTTDADDETDAEKTLRPQIYLMSNGELNPFNLLIGYDDDAPIFYRLKASINGKISLEGPIQDSMRYVLGRTP